MSKRFKRLQALYGPHMAAGPTALGRADGPEARNADGGPQGRTCARPALLPKPRRPARAEKGPSRPSGAGGAEVRRLKTPPPPPRPPLPPLRCSPDVGPTSPKARMFSFGHPLAARPNTAAPASARDQTTPDSAAPTSRNEPYGPQPGVRRGWALRRTQDADCSNRRGARLRVRQSSTIGQKAGRRNPTPYEF